MLAAEKIVITTLVENYVDMLIPDTENVKRPGLAYHFDTRNMKIRAENGLALLVDVHLGHQCYRILLDTGLTDDVILHNMKALGISPNEIDHVVISHGHPDHYGGLLGLLKARSLSENKPVKFVKRDLPNYQWSETVGGKFYVGICP